MSVRVMRYIREFLAVIALILISIPVAVYIVDHQRLRFPWEDVMTIEAEFKSAQSVTPGQGQTVTVAGVKVGEISKVTLEEGVAVVEMELDEEQLGPIYENATMLLRPKTGLNDMSVQLDPGTPDKSREDGGRLREGDRLPASQTRPNVNPDEVFAELDLDTRRYLSVLANAGGDGLRGRGKDLRAVLRASEPTLERTARITRSIADRRKKLRRLVTNLRTLSRSAASKDEELASLVDASASVFRTIGDRERELSESVARLPGALNATRGALSEARGLANELGPAARELRPAARKLAPALIDIRPLLRDGLPILRDDLRPLVREATPLLRDLLPATRDLETSAPPLVRTGKVLNYVANELGYNPPGDEEGYLFWTAWFFNNAASILTVEDAHGGTWRGLVMVGCSSLGEVLSANPALAPLAQVPLCPAAGGGNP